MLALALTAMMAIPTQAGTLKSWVENEMRAHHIPGMVVGVYRDGKPVEVVASGYADLEGKVKVRRQTQFEICSITKQFAASAVLLLVQDGKMGLDDPISKYLPGIPVSWSGVTIRRLLDHTSGVPDRIFDDSLFSKPEGDVIAGLAARPLEFRPGDRWSYNNTGYWLVGKAIEKASGQGFFEFLADRIFKPLGMKHTFPNRTESVVPWRARGYTFVNGTYKNASPLSDAEGYAAGGLISTIDDLNIWSRALTSGKVLNAKSRAEMLKPGMLNSGEQAWNRASSGYGLGVFLGDANGHRFEKHSGGWVDASCQLTRFLDDGLTVVVLTNLGGYDQRSYAGEMVGHLFDRSIKIPAWKTKPDPDPQTAQVAAKVIAGLAARHVDHALYTELQAEILKENADDFVTQLRPLGALKGLKFVQRVSQGPTMDYVYRAIFNRAMIFVLTVTKDGKVADLELFEPPSTSSGSE